MPLWKVYIDGGSMGGNFDVRLYAVVQVEARDEREAQEKAREIVMERVKELASGGLVSRVKNRIDAWVRR